MTRLLQSAWFIILIHEIAVISFFTPRPQPVTCQRAIVPFAKSILIQLTPIIILYYILYYNIIYNINIYTPIPLPPSPYLKTINRNGTMARWHVSMKWWHMYFPRKSWIGYWRTNPSSSASSEVGPNMATTVIRINVGRRSSRRTSTEKTVPCSTRSRVLQAPPRGS